MKTYRLVHFIEISVFVSSCVQVGVESVDPLDSKQEMTITAFAPDPETRTERTADGAVLWSPGDQISLFYGSGDNGGSCFTGQNTEPAKVVNFTGKIGVITGGNDVAVEDTYFWAVYPYNPTASCDGSSITTVLPSAQVAKADTFADDLFPSVGRSQGLVMGFYNICGGLKFTVSEGGIKSVTLRGHNDEDLAGKITVALDSNGLPVVTNIADGSKEITVSAPSGEYFEPGHSYYIVLVPTVFENGFTLTFSKDNARATYDRTKKTTIRRSAFGGLTTPDAGLEWDCPLKSLTFVPWETVNGLGVITLFELHGGTLDKAQNVNPRWPRLYDDSFKRVKQTGNKYMATAPTWATYRMNPSNVKFTDYTFKFINRADPDEDSLLEVVGTSQDGFSLNVWLSLKESLNGQDNVVVALEATSKRANAAGEFEKIVSDDTYLESYKNDEYQIIDKIEWDDNDNVAPYRVDFIDIADDFDIHAQLQYKETLDLLTIVETYARDAQTDVARQGIEAKYEFFFAGTAYCDGTGLYKISKNGSEVFYVASNEHTNQNQFVVLDGSVISVNTSFVSLGSPAINRTPLIYVRSFYEKGNSTIYLADAFIKVKVVEDIEEPQVGPDLGWDVFITHDVKFEYDKLPAAGNQPTFTGGEGLTGAPRVPYGPKVDSNSNNLAITWMEMNVWVFNDRDVDMSATWFGTGVDVNGQHLDSKYLANEQDLMILLTTDRNNNVIEPGAQCPAFDDPKTFVAPLADLHNCYGSAINIDAPSPTTWGQGTNVISLSLNKEVGNLGKTHYVYVLYPARDNTKNIGVVVRFSYTVM